MHNTTDFSFTGHYLMHNKTDIPFSGQALFDAQYDRFFFHWPFFDAQYDGFFFHWAFFDTTDFSFTGHYRVSCINGQRDTFSQKLCASVVVSLDRSSLQTVVTNMDDLSSSLLGGFQLNIRQSSILVPLL